MALICPWCGGELLGKPGQYAKCRHCSSDIFWGDGKPFKSNLEARHAEAQKTARHRTPVPKGVQSRRPTEPSQDVIDARFRHQLLKQKNTLDEGGQRLNILDRLLLLIVRILNRNKPKQVVVDRFLSTRRTFIKTAHSIQRIPRILSLTVVFLIAAFFVFIAGFLTPRVIEPHVTPVVNKITQLTTEVAQQLASLEVPELDLSEVTSISDGAAKELAQWKGDSIKLVGLKSLDTQSAQELAKWKGSTLDLSGLKEITQTAASAFKSWSGSLLRLNGLESVNDDVAETLASFQATSVELLGLISVGKDTFAILKVNPKLSLPEIKFEPVELPVMAETVDDSFKALVSKGSDGFETLTSLTIVQAKYLIENFQGKLLNLSGLTSINKDVAQELAKYEGGLYLDGLTSIDKEIAQELAKFKGRLSLGLTSIDKDVAQELAKFEGQGLMLYRLTSIDKSVAQELAKFKGTKKGRLDGRRLNLNGLTTIDKDVAQELAKFKGVLWLSGLTSIDKDVAQELAKVEEKLKLDGLTLIDKDVAQELAKCKGALYLYGLTSIDQETFDILITKPNIKLPSNLSPSTLTPKESPAPMAETVDDSFKALLSDQNGLETLTSMTIVQAKYLIENFQGKRLKLSGLTSIDKDVAQELAKFKGKGLPGGGVLSFFGLTSIDKDVAEELAKFKGHKMSLGLTSIDKDVAQKLAKFEGVVLNFSALTSIDKEVAQELAKFEGIYFEGRKAGMLDLVLTSIDKDVAHELANSKTTTLGLFGLTSIDKEVAEELAKYDGNLRLYSLTSVDKEVAQELAKFEGRKFYLNKLTSIDKDVLKILKSNKSIALPEKYRD